LKVYLVTLAVGLLVGLIYGFLNVRSPAPPVIALVGLLGILAGEQAVPWIRKLIDGEPVSIGAVRRDCSAHMFAALPRVESAPRRDRAGSAG
jgi:XapX domain-containing protein